MSAGVDAEVMLKLPVKCWGRGVSESERKREFDDITWSNYRLKVKRICMLSIQISPAAWQTKSSIFCTALMLFREWGERTRCRGDEGEDGEVQVKGENRNR